MNILRLGLMLAAALFWSGCSLHQPVEPPEMNLPDAYLSGQGASAEGLAVPWWERFGDMRLNALMEEMLQGNLRLEQGVARLEQARALARSAGSARYPSLNAGGELARSRTPSQFGVVIGSRSQFSLAAAFELDLWGRLRQRQRAAELQAEASRHDLQTLYLGLTAELAELYYLAIEQRALLALTDRTIASLTDTVQRVDARYRLGVAPAIDLYQAEQNLAAAEAIRPQYENALASAENGLALLLGRYPDRSTAGDEASLPHLDRPWPSGVPADLLQQRPDVAASFARLWSADADVAVALAERLPNVSLVGSLGRSRQDYSSGLIEGNFWNLAGNLALPLIDGGRRRAEVDRTRSVVAERMAAYRQTVLQAAREVEDALTASRVGEERIARLEKSSSVAAATLRVSLQNYLHGVADYLPVLTAQRNDFQARSALLNAKRQQLSNFISLSRALAGDWLQDHLEKRQAAITHHKEQP
ncbi:MAG: hypothetical protein C0616_04230 [Desulfuromonas sp.]|nr:MAG: hypothetical protein C0616_04230 [Desulfuromonas sp.]